MLESLATTILNRFLGDYVSNLNYEQLKIGIWNGELNLNNLKLRKNALDRLKLPLNISEGYLDKLKLIIPWSNIRKEPVKIIINHIYLLANPKNEATMTAEEEEDRLHSLKMNRVRSAEESIVTEDEAAQDNNSFTNQLINAIIDKLQVTILNIHIRYEDAISDPDHPCAIGIKLNELSVLSDNKNEQENQSNIIDKLIKLDSLSIYGDTDVNLHLNTSPKDIPTVTNSASHHQYILKPISGFGKFKINKRASNQLPKVDISLLFDELAFNLDDRQYRALILIIDLFHDNLKKQKYLRYHPERGKTVKSHPKDFFKFAANVVLSEIHERNYKWTWDHFKKRRDQRKLYIQCYIAEKTNTATEELLEKLGELERTLSYQDIMFYRSLSRSKMRQENIKIEKEQEEQEDNTSNKKQGWLYSLFSRKSNSRHNNNTRKRIRLTEEEKKELERAIEYNDDNNDIVSAIELPKDKIKFSLKAHLKRGSFTLKQDVKKPTESEIVSVIFDIVTIDFIHYLESFKVTATLGDLVLLDGTKENTQYPKLIGVKNNNNYVQQQQQDKNTPFLFISFEKKPLDNRADNAFEFRMRHLEIIYSPEIIHKIVQFFKPPRPEMESVNALIEVAGDTFEGLKRQTKAGLKYALESHTTFDIDVDMYAPIIIIPKSLGEKETYVVIIDSGHISIDSQVADKELLNQITPIYSEITDQDDDFPTDYKSLMYDKFNVSLSETKIFIGTNVEQCLYQLNHHTAYKGKDNRLIQPIDMNLLLEKCILPGNTEFTKFKVSVHLPILSINFSDEKYKALMGIIDFIIPKDEETLADTENKQLQRPVMLINRNPSTTNSNSSSINRKNIIMEHFWGHLYDEVFLPDSDSSTSTSSSCSEYNLSTILKKDMPMDSSQLEQFRLSFQVDKVSASIIKSSSSREDTLLCELVLEDFELIVLTRPADLSVDVALRALNVIDPTNKDKGFHYLLTSNNIDKEQQLHSQNEQKNKNLVHVTYKSVSRENPRFSDVYDSFDQTVDVTMSTLTIIIAGNSIWEIYNWIMETFTSPQQPQEPKEIPDIEVESIKQKRRRSSQPDNKKEQENRKRRSRRSDRTINAIEEMQYLKKSSIEPSNQKNMQKEIPNDKRMKVILHMDSVRFILNDNGTRVGTGELHHGSITILLEPKTMEVVGKLGNFTLSDATASSLNNKKPSYIVSIEGEELANFSYSTYDPLSMAFPGYHQSLKLKMGVVRLLVSDGLKSTMNFLTHFFEMKAVYDNARNAAIMIQQNSNSSSNSSNSSGQNRFHFDIQIKSPVVIIPAPYDDVLELTAHLGEIRAKNQFKLVDRVQHIPHFQSVSINQISCGLFDISLHSTKGNNDNYHKRKGTGSITEKLSISLEIEIVEHPEHSIGPLTQIRGNISNFHIALTENQYKTILASWDYIQKTFIFPENNNEVSSTDKSNTINSNHETASIISQPPISEEITHLYDQDSSFSAVRFNLDVFIGLELISMDIFTGEEEDNDNDNDEMNKDNHQCHPNYKKANEKQDFDKKKALSRLSFEKVHFQLQQLSNTSMKMEASIRDVKFEDTRPNSNSKFKDILPANRLSYPQFQFKLSSYKQHQDGYNITDINFTVDSPIIILSISYIHLLKDFFMSPFKANPTPTATNDKDSIVSSLHLHNNENRSLESTKTAPMPERSKLIYKINIVDLELICLESSDEKDSEAIILSLKQLIIQQDDDSVLHVDLSGANMALCRMECRKESTINFIEEFGVTLKIKTSNVEPTALRLLQAHTSIELSVQPIILRLSYYDFILIGRIVNKGIQLIYEPENNNNNDNQTLETETNFLNTTTIFDTQQQQQSSDFLMTPNASYHALPSVNILPEEKEPISLLHKETLTATFEGVQIVLIESVYQLPFLDTQIYPFVLSAKNWSTALQLDVDICLKVNNYNLNNSHWEPTLEPWRFKFMCTKKDHDKCTSISLFSDELLYVNVTHALVEGLIVISQKFTQTRSLKQVAQAQTKPYCIRNFTGHSLYFWNMSDDSDETDYYRQKLESGGTTAWIFRDWKKRRERVNVSENLCGIEFDNAWKNNLCVPLDREGERSYRLEPDIHGIHHRLVVDIKLENYIKQVTFRSGLVLKNNSGCAGMQVAIVNHKRQFLADIIYLDPDKCYYVPIKYCYNSWIVIRPSDGYHWSDEMMTWSDVILPDFPRYIHCKSQEDSSNLSTTIYQIYPDYDRINPITKMYPFMTIHFCPPIKIENLLPFDIDVSMKESLNPTIIENGQIISGNTIQFSKIKSDVELNISIDIKLNKYRGGLQSTIKTTSNYIGIGEKLVVLDENNSPISLMMNVSRTKSTLGSLVISIFAPYVIINKLGLELYLKGHQSYRSGIRRCKSKAEYLPAYEKGAHIEPVLFSYPTLDRHNRVLLSIDGSKWSKPVSFEAVGSSQDVTLFCKTNNTVTHSGISIEEGIGTLRLTKIVTITPRYIFKNKLSIDLQLSEFGYSNTTKAQILKSEETFALYHTSSSSSVVKWFCLIFDNEVSCPFSIMDIGQSFIKLKEHLVKCSVSVHEATIFITFSKVNEWPYRIVNDSSVQLEFYQGNIKLEDDMKLTQKQKQELYTPKLYILQPGDRMWYAWDFPIVKNKILFLKVGKRKRQINFQAIGTQVPFVYSKHRGNSAQKKALSLDIVAADTVVILHVKDYKKERLYRMKSSVSSIFSLASSDDVYTRIEPEKLKSSHVIQFVFDLKLAGIGISMITKHAHELLFATLKEIDFKYTDSNIYQSIRLGIQWIQIDNQLYGSVYPILFYPSTLPKLSSDSSLYPTLHISLDKVKDDRHGVMYFKLFSILLQEMSLELDENFLYEIIDFFTFSSILDGEENIEPSFIMDIAEPSDEKAQAIYFFEEFCIQPMKLNISFMRVEKLTNESSTPLTGQEESRTNIKGLAMNYVFDVFTMTLGNINDAPIKLNALIIENLRSSSQDLTNRISLHYKDQIIYQIHRVLGSVDFLGNPIGLFNTLGSGFKEMFYEPYQGFILSDRPQDLGVGIAKGIGGFMKKGVFGVTDSMSKFTGSLGKGISAATMDKKFRDRRTNNMMRNKPTHAMYGLTSGVTEFGMSIASGIAGLVKRPLEGAEKYGPIGFVGGIGKGLIGLVTKPIAGFFDMTSSFAAGIRETTTVFQDDGIIERERLPRYIGKNSILIPFSQREALGQIFLKEVDNGRFFNNHYIAHVQLDDIRTIAILTYENILIVRTDNQKTEHLIALDKVKECVLIEREEEECIILKLKKGSRLLKIPEQTSRIWFYSKIGATLAERKEAL